MFKGGTRDYIIINKQVCASRSCKKRGYHFAFRKLLLKEAIQFLSYNCFFSIGNIIMIQVIGTLIGSDPARFFSNLFQPSKKLIGLIESNVKTKWAKFEFHTRLFDI